MAIKIRDVLLKTVPYLLSVAGGIVLFLLTKDNIHNENIADLVNNISGSLLAIPFVFLLYDYSNYRISRQLNKTLSDNLNDKINGLLLNMVLLLRQMMGLRANLTLESLNKMADLRTSEIATKLKISSASMNTLQTYHENLDNLIYSNAKNNILSIDQVQTLSDIARNLQHLINEYNFHKNKKVAAKYIAQILVLLTDWMDSDASASLHFQQLLNGMAPTVNTNKK